MRRLVTLFGPAIAIAACLSTTIAHGQSTSAGGWVTAWGTSQQMAAMTGISNATVRLVARVSVPGEAVRIRIDNSYGTAPLTIGKATIGWRRGGATVFPGSTRPVSFKGASEATIPAGGTITSDPVAIKVRARQDLAISLYIPGADVRPSQHLSGQVTSFMTANGAGDVTNNEAAAPFTVTTTSVPWVKAIDVQSSGTRGAIVTFGDSITDGSCATPDGYERWPDFLLTRLNLDGRRMAVVNEGIGGNTILAKHPEPQPPTGMPGIERLDRDVLAHHGVTHVVLFMGTNDMRRSATAVSVGEGMQNIISRLKAKGIKVYGGTAIPRHNNTQINWTDAKTAERNLLNEWIRTKAPFDGVIDFDKVVRDEANPNLINPAFDCDGIHPTGAGYYEMAKAINLDWFGKR
jgi:lysophospholipase L1-like esterase